MKLTSKERLALEWLANKPDAKLVIRRVGKETIDAVVVFAGMPIAMNPDEEVPDFHVNWKTANRLLKHGFVQHKYAIDIANYERSLYQRSIYFHEYFINEAGQAALSPKQPERTSHDQST